MANLSQRIGGFPPKPWRSGENRRFDVNWNQGGATPIAKGDRMKAAGFVIQVGFGLGLALGAVALLLL
ncbi:hypothetical protein [Paracoccus binzhouensis]|uniref:hypothetical protein n=1 Tax=Paracoccus binzhouensis TaxID=2796149 RepID=UPI0018EF2959|nr:hypothetical protein [Paracoccus binzhouensis]